MADHDDGGDVVDVVVPGDKSIALRAVLLSLLAAGKTSTVRGVPPGRIFDAGLAAARALGADVVVTDRDEHERDIVIRAPRALQSGAVIDCGGSATLARLLLGLLAGAGVDATLTGSEMLSRRPMARAALPLMAVVGEDVISLSDGRLPARISGPSAKPCAGAIVDVIDSAQVRAAVSLCAIAAGVPVTLRAPGSQLPRRHTEQLVARLGVAVTSGSDGGRALTTLSPGAELAAVDMRLPADPSAAAFIQALAVGGRRPLRALGVVVDRERSGFLRALQAMGVEAHGLPETASAPDDVTSLVVADSTVAPCTRLRPLALAAADVADLVDEVPMLAGLAALADGESQLRGLAELRVKESDRLSRVADLVVAFGARAHISGDDLVIFGVPAARGAGGAAVPIVTDHDHRIGMSALVLSALTGRDVVLDDPDCVDESWPHFRAVLADVRRRSS